MGQPHDGLDFERILDQGVTDDIKASIFIVQAHEGQGRRNMVYGVCGPKLDT